MNDNYNKIIQCKKSSSVWTQDLYGNPNFKKITEKYIKCLLEVLHEDKALEIQEWYKCT